MPGPVAAAVPMLWLQLPLVLPMRAQRVPLLLAAVGAVVVAEVEVVVEAVANWPLPKFCPGMQVSGLSFQAVSRSHRDLGLGIGPLQKSSGGVLAFRTS